MLHPQSTLCLLVVLLCLSSALAQGQNGKTVLILNDDEYVTTDDFNDINEDVGDALDDNAFPLKAARVTARVGRDDKGKNAFLTALSSGSPPMAAVIPSLSKGSLHDDQDMVAGAWKFANGGGILIVAGSKKQNNENSRTARFLRAMYPDWSRLSCVTECSPGESTATEAKAGTKFKNLQPDLESMTSDNNNKEKTYSCTGLPSGAVAVYTKSNEATVWIKDVGSNGGLVVYLGFNWGDKSSKSASKSGVETWQNVLSTALSVDFLCEDPIASCGPHSKCVLSGGTQVCTCEEGFSRSSPNTDCQIAQVIVLKSDSVSNSRSDNMIAALAGSDFVTIEDESRFFSLLDSVQYAVIPSLRHEEKGWNPPLQSLRDFVNNGGTLILSGDKNKEARDLIDNLFDTRSKSEEIDCKTNPYGSTSSVADRPSRMSALPDELQGAEDVYSCRKLLNLDGMETTILYSESDSESRRVNQDTYATAWITTIVNSGGQLVYLGFDWDKASDDWNTVLQLALEMSKDCSESQTLACGSNSDCTLNDGGTNVCTCWEGFTDSDEGCKPICTIVPDGIGGVPAVKCDGIYYATLDSAIPDAGTPASQVGALTLPLGWDLVPDGGPELAAKISAFSWETGCVVFQNGNCYVRDGSAVELQSSNYLSTQYDDSAAATYGIVNDGEFGVTSSFARVLMYTTQACVDGPLPQNGKWYSSRTSCVAEGSCTNALAYQEYDTPGYNNDKTCGTVDCTSAQVGEEYTDDSGAGSCAVADCTSAARGYYYTTAGVCDAIACTEPENNQYFVTPGKCDVSDCDNAQNHQYYKKWGDGGALALPTSNCELDSCTNTQTVGKYFSAAGNLESDSCDVACAAGYWLDGNSCVVCAAGKFKSYVGDAPSGCTGHCEGSPPRNEDWIPSANDNADDCLHECEPGFFRDGDGKCKECSPGSYKTDAGDGACTSCPNTYHPEFMGSAEVENSEWIMTRSSSNRGNGDRRRGGRGDSDRNDNYNSEGSPARISDEWCKLQCDPGYTLDIVNGCVPCPQGSYKEGRGNQECSACPYDVKTSGSRRFRAPALVDHSSWKENGNAWTDKSQCTLECHPGFTLKDNGNDRGSCKACSAGKYKSGTNLNDCRDCSSSAMESRSRLPFGGNADWTYDVANQPATENDECTWACDAGYGAREIYRTRSSRDNYRDDRRGGGGGGSDLRLDDVICVPCAEAEWNEPPAPGSTYRKCKTCYREGLLKPPNSAYTYQGTSQSTAAMHDDAGTACQFTCNPPYGGDACDETPDCAPGQFYDPAYNYGGGNGSCLTFFPEPKPFNEARQICISAGYDIAIIRDQEENTLFGYVRDTWAWKQEGESPRHTLNPPETYHGLSDRASEGNWYYVVSSFKQLATFKPWGGSTSRHGRRRNEDCAVMDGKAGETYWTDVPCEVMRPFVCAVPRTPVARESCPENAALACPPTSSCTMEDGVPVCLCPEGMVGDGLECSGDAWSVKMSILIREVDDVLVTGLSASGTRKLDHWESEHQDFAALLTPRGFRNGYSSSLRHGSNRDRRLLQTEGADAIPGLPAGFMTSMEHNVVDINDVLNGVLDVDNVGQGWITVSDLVYQDTQYVLTVNALFADRDDAEDALDELLFNLEGDQTWSSEPVWPVVFGISLDDSARYLPPRIYRWVAPTTSAALEIKPTGMTVEGVFFEPSCETSGCWIVDVLFTIGSDNFNTFFLPEAVGDDELSYDFFYGENDEVWGKSPADTFLPVNFPCGSDDYDPEAPRNAPGSNAPLNAPDAVTGCCIPEFIDMYRPTAAFVRAMEIAGISKASCDLDKIPIFNRPRYEEPYGALISAPTQPYSGPAINCTTSGLAEALDEISEGEAVCFDGKSYGRISHLIEADPLRRSDGSATLAWVLQAPLAGAMEITFNFFQTVFNSQDPAAAEWVTIYECDAALTNCDVLATASGAYDRFSVTSCSGVMVVTFTPSMLIPLATFATGFKATYESLTSCPYRDGDGFPVSGKSMRAPANTDKSATDASRVPPQTQAAVIDMPGNQLYGNFRGMDNSYSVFTEVVDPFIGQYRARMYLDEVELRRNAGQLRGTVGVEYTVDTFLGLANFKPSGIDFLDPFATQTAIHLEKTSFFSVSTHGVNDYTFLEYVNMRLVSILSEDTDFSGEQDTNGMGDSEAGNRTVRTLDEGDAGYVQVTFTMGSQYQPNLLSGGLIPLDSVRAGLGTFFQAVEAAGQMEHVCDGYYDTMSGSDFLGLTYENRDTKENFESLVGQTCGPRSKMCLSPTSTPDSFVSFNIPLGIDVFDGKMTSDLSQNVFVSFVVNALDTDPNVGGTAGPTPNKGNDPKQMKTTLTASIPIVAGGLNVFCDGVTAKTDLKDLANVDIVVGTAKSIGELSRLRIVQDIASTDLSSEPSAEINTDSIESALMTLVIKGDHAYFSGTGRNTLDYTMELDDVITIHLMVDGNGRAANSKETELVRLLALPADDNSDATGLDIDGYALNGAFSFTVNRGAAAGTSLASLKPSTALMAVCPFNPPRPAAGNAPLESCITRRDVQSRGYPNRNGAPDTAMEILAASSPKDSLERDIDDLAAGLDSDSDESEFLTTILGDNDYAKSLAVSFAQTIHERYNLNGRYRRAYWINPGYEWTPTQTNGKSIFSVSQKIYLFALVTLDENWGRRRMLLQASSDKLQENSAGMNSASVAFDVSPMSMMAQAFGVPEARVATFAVKMQLTQAEACLDLLALQNAIRATLDDYVQSSITEYHTLQVTQLNVDKGDVVCGRRRVQGRKLLATFSSASADVTMLVVFKEGGVSKIDLARISKLPGIQAITVTPNSPLSPVIETFVHPGEVIRTPAPGTSTSSSSNTALIAGIAGGVGGLLVAIGAMFAYVRYSRKEAVQPVAITAVDMVNLKSQLQADL